MRPEIRPASHDLRKTQTVTAQNNVKTENHGAGRIYGYLPTPTYEGLLLALLTYISYTSLYNQVLNSLLNL